MNEELKERLNKAKVGLVDLVDVFSMEGIKVENPLVQRRILRAIEAIDDALEGKVRFPSSVVEKNG